MYFAVLCEIVLSQHDAARAVRYSQFMLRYTALVQTAGAATFVVPVPVPTTVPHHDSEIGM